MDLKDLLKKAFEAGEIYNGNLEFGEYAEPFKDWYDNLDKSLLFRVAISKRKNK